MAAACRGGDEDRGGAADAGAGGGKPQVVLVGATMPPESALEAAVRQARRALATEDPAAAT